MRLQAFTICLLGLLGAAASAKPGVKTPSGEEHQPDVIRVGAPMKRFHLLTPGTRLYLRYKIGKDGSRSTMDIWRRTVSFENRDGRRLVHISQRWDGVVPPAYTLRQDSWFEPETFRPLTHERELTRDGKTIKRAYQYFEDHIVLGPDPNVEGAKETIVASPEPAFNFETDMELFETLPLAAGYEASLNFYDPGQAPPKRYRFKVTGEATIKAADGREVPCWVLSSEPENPAVPAARYWFAKSTQVLLREQAKLPDGSILVKTLLTDEADDSAN